MRLGVDRVPMQHARAVLGCLFKKGVQRVPLAALHERREQVKPLCQKNPRACAALSGRRVGKRLQMIKEKALHFRAFLVPGRGVEPLLPP